MRVPNSSDELMDFALFVLDHAADSVLAGAGPLVPFSVVEVDGERRGNRTPPPLRTGLNPAFR